MNGYQRIRAMLNGEPIDRVPIAGWRHFPLREIDPRDFCTQTVNYTRNNGWDLCKIMYHAFYFMEDYGAVIRYTQDPNVWNGQIVKRAWDHPADMLSARVLDVKSGHLGNYLEATRRICDQLHGEVPVIATVFSPLTVVKDNFGFYYHEILEKLMEHNPRELTYALESITETEIEWVRALRNAGCDGVFFATQVATPLSCTLPHYIQYDKSYSAAVLDEAARLGMWFNVLHIHGNNDLYFKESLDLNAQAISWENLIGERRTTLEQARSMTDKILCCGIDRENDFRCKDNDRNQVYQTLQLRLTSALREAGGKDRLIFAPGCSIKVADPEYLSTLIREVVEEYFSGS